MRVAAITGGAQGIGRAIALSFASAGFNVSIADPATDAGEEAAQLVEALGARCLYFPADVAKPEDVHHWMAQTTADLACPEVLVNNAGISAGQPFLDLSVGDFDRVLAVNVRGTFLCSQHAAREMVANQIKGSIINIASTRALMSEADTEAYTASKGAIVALTHAMAVSLGRYGIRVNCISPGWIEKRDWQYSGRAETPVHTAEDKAQHPVGRVGVPADVAQACLFLAQHADFMTGQNLVIDGGMTVKMIYA